MRADKLRALNSLPSTMNARLESKKLTAKGQALVYREEQSLQNLSGADIDDDGPCAEVDLGEIGRRNDLGARRAG